MRIRFVAAAVPVLLAGTLAAAAAPGLGQAAEGDQNAAEPKTVGVAKLAATNPCTGGVQKKSFTGGHADWFWTSTSDSVPGAQFQFKGPQKKKDTVFVTVTAPGTYSDSGDRGRVRVQLNGVDMAPASGAPEYFYGDGTSYPAFAGQYCAKVGKGIHQVRLELEAIDGNASGSATAYLFNPMIHVEVAE